MCDVQQLELFVPIIGEPVLKCLDHNVQVKCGVLQIKTGYRGIVRCTKIYGRCVVKGCKRYCDISFNNWVIWNE